MKKIQFIAFFIVFIGLSSCDGDDGLLEAEAIAPQTLAETVVENDSAIIAFLETHFYNYEEFETPPADFDFKVEIDTISGDNADKLPLMNFVETQTILVPELDDEDVEIAHTLYFIQAKEGEGTSPTIGDDVFVNYEGILLDRTPFDGSTTPIVFNLSGVVRGFGNGVTKLRSGFGPMENGDGTVSYSDFGVGIVIMPSGLGYFNSPPTAIIPFYAPLVFSVELLSFIEDTDADGDGIPSYLEDIDGDGNLNNDNTDEESEIGFFVPNYQDADDDGDGTLTLDEISDEDGNIIIPYPDSDGDGTPDYLDPDVS